MEDESRVSSVLFRVPRRVSAAPWVGGFGQWVLVWKKKKEEEKDKEEEKVRNLHGSLQPQSSNSLVLRVYALLYFPAGSAAAAAVPVAVVAVAAASHNPEPADSNDPVVWALDADSICKYRHTAAVVVAASGSDSPNTYPDAIGLVADLVDGFQAAAGFAGYRYSRHPFAVGMSGVEVRFHHRRGRIADVESNCRVVS